MTKPLHAFEFLQKSKLETMPETIALVGDDRFLKKLVLQRLFPRDDDRADCQTISGPGCDWPTLHDDLCTASLFAAEDRRILLTDADEFVSRNRERLEQYVQQPSGTAALLLDIKSLPANTRLYKALLASAGIILCKLPEQRGRPDEPQLRKWLEAWAKSHHKIALGSAATDRLVDLIGWELGLLDQELAKLALFVETNGQVDANLVDRVVGGWRTQTTWEMLDSIASGKADEALLQLDQLLRSGETPLALMGSLAWSLRRFAAATRIYQQMEQETPRPSLVTALERAGFRKWPQGAMQKAETQLKQITRPRASQLYRWLLETDLALKGSHAAPHRARFALEKLILRLSREARR